MRIRAIPCLLVTGALFAVAWLAWLCRLNPQTSFLSAHSGAHWIVYPKAPVPHLQAVAELPAAFKHAFQLTAVPSSAILTLRFCRHGDIFLNGKPIPLPAADGNWKKPRSLEVTSWLHPGENQLLVTVQNHVGPPALWLTLTGPGISIRTDPSWQASYAGAVWRAAQLANQSAAGVAGSPLRAPPPNLGEVLRHHVWFYGALLLGSLLIVLAGRTWFARAQVAGVALPPRWAWVRQPPALALIAIMLLWVLLLTHNAALVPRNAGFDTTGHLQYIDLIQTYSRLPAADQGWETHQPPLYYLLGATLLSSFGLTTSAAEGLVLLRLLGLAIGLAQLTFIFLSLRLLFPIHPGRQLVGLVVAGFLPMHLYLTHYATNEILVACLISATIYLTLKLIHADPGSWRLYALTGLGLGLALLSKVTALLLSPFVAGALVYQGYRWRTGGWKRIGFPGLAFVICMAVAGWHYLLVWRQFGHPLFAETRWAFGISWWQDPGYRTAAYFTRFGHGLVDPFFSGTSGFADGLYSTLWGDGLIGGAAAWLFAAPWNYGLMTIGYWLALLPTMLLLAGLAIALARSFSKTHSTWAGLSAFGCLIFLGLIHLNLVVPTYAVAKSFYALSGLAVWSAFGALAWGLVERSNKWVIFAAATALTFWAGNSYASFWIDGRSPATHALIGRSLMRNSLPEAIQKFRSALQIDPQHLAARSFLCTALLQQGETAEAAALASETTKLHPDQALAHLDWAAVLEAQDQLAASVTETKLAIQSEPDNPEARLRLASRLLQSQAYPETLAASREALRLSPSDPEIHLILGSALAALARTSPDFRESGFEDLSGPSPNPQRDGNEDLSRRAISHIELALKLSPNFAAALNNLAWIRATHPLSQLRNGAEALRLAQRACTLTSNRNANMLATLAAAYAETGQYSRAVQVAQQGAQVASAQGAKAALVTNRRLIELFSKQQPFRDAGHGN
jgi:tetratricopeptide (TPR) repeat protein